MKRLTLRTLPIGNQGKLDYRAELLSLCQVSQEGVTVDEIPLYLELSAKLQSNAESIELTETEHALLLFRLRSHRWRVIVPEILQFYQDVATAPEIE